MTEPGDINAVVIGATGYVGGELLRLLAQHPDFSPLRGGIRQPGRCNDRRRVSASRRRMCRDDLRQRRRVGGSARRGRELALFSAAPHGASAARRRRRARGSRHARPQSCTWSIVRQTFVMPMRSGIGQVYGERAWRRRSCSMTFRAPCPSMATGRGDAARRPPGLFRNRRAACGCSARQKRGLPPAPMFVSAITGSTGSGRTAQPGTHHPERHSNLYAYKALSHRHAPEIEQPRRTGWRQARCRQLRAAFGAVFARDLCDPAGVARPGDVSRGRFARRSRTITPARTSCASWMARRS